MRSCELFELISYPRVGLAVISDTFPYKIRTYAFDLDFDLDPKSENRAPTSCWGD